MTSRVLIVDDHPMIRSAVAMLLAGSNFTIVGNAASARAADEAIRELDPEIVILDIAMPGGSGIEVLKRLRKAGDRRPVIILTAGIDDYRLGDALGLAVDGIVMKNNDPALLLECLESVRAGRRWIDPEVQPRADEIMRRGPEGHLSARERQLVRLVGQGLRNREIAEKLGLTEGSVKVYLQAIFEKLGVATRTELALRAADEGFGD